MANLTEIIGDPIVFLDEIFHQLKDLNLDVSPYFLDHLCYRVKSVSEYEEKKAALGTMGTLLIESMVNGRLISTFKLHDPIVYEGRLIDVLELPSVKPHQSYESGLEHVEFVTTDSLYSIVEKLPALAFEVGGIDKKINADITLKLKKHCIRFHNQSLEDVIEEEKKHV